MWGETFFMTNRMAKAAFDGRQERILSLFFRQHPFIRRCVQNNMLWDSEKAIIMPRQKKMSQKWKIPDMTVMPFHFTLARSHWQCFQDKQEVNTFIFENTKKKFSLPRTTFWLTIYIASNLVTSVVRWRKKNIQARLKRNFKRLSLGEFKRQKIWLPSEKKSSVSKEKGKKFNLKRHFPTIYTSIS